jgi:large subunit ribosomal protein L25
LRPDVAAERVRLEVKERDSRGSRSAKRLRREGFVPGVLYGGSGKARAFYVAERELHHALGGEHGTHAILDVVLDGQQKTHHAVLKDYQLDPTRARLLHIDLHEVRLDRAIHAQVVVELTGESEGVKEGGVLSQVNREVTVEALPMDVPDRLVLDVSGMAIGDSLRVSDLRVPESVKVLTDQEAVLANVTPPTKVEEPEPEEVPEEEAELAEGEVPPEERPEGEGEEAGEPKAEGAGAQQTTEG